MPRHRRLVAWLGAAGLVAGCVGVVEQQFTIYAENDLEVPAILRFGYWGDILIKPGVNGRAAHAFGTFPGPILVFDANCRLLHTVEVTAQVGHVWLRSDGSVRFAEVEYDGDQVQLPHTDQCTGATN